MGIDTEQFPDITVEWMDHYSEFEQGYSMDDVIKMVRTPAIRKTKGFLIYEGQRQIAIAGTIDFEEGEYSFCEVFVCMKRAIVSRSDKPKGEKKRQKPSLSQPSCPVSTEITSGQERG